MACQGETSKGCVTQFGIQSRCWLGCHAGHSTLPKTDCRGKSSKPGAERALAASPARIVSLGGALTEVVYLLGAQGQLVGTDTTSLFPEAALKTAKVGYMRQLSAEGLLSLKPDAVVGTTEAGPPVVLDQVRSAGVRVELVAADHSWDEVRRKVALVRRNLCLPTRRRIPVLKSCVKSCRPQ